MAYKRKILTTQAARSLKSLGLETLAKSGVNGVIALGKQKGLNFSWCTECRTNTPDVETVVETFCLVCNGSK
jgi:hypothetical protein